MAEHEENRRRSVRIPGADYAAAGGYVITICTSNRRNILGKIENGSVAITQLGEIVANCWRNIPAHFQQAELEEFIVMPNHLYGVIVLRPKAVGARYIMPVHPHTRALEAFQKPVRGSIPTIVRTFTA